MIAAVLDDALDVGPLERAIDAVDWTAELGDALEAVVVIRGVSATAPRC